MRLVNDTNAPYNIVDHTKSQYVDNPKKNSRLYETYRSR